MITIDQLPSDMTWARFLRDAAPEHAPYAKGMIVRKLTLSDEYMRCYVREIELKQYYFVDNVYRYIGHDEIDDVWYWR